MEREPKPNMTNPPEPPYRIPLGTSGDYVELRPSIQSNRFFFKGEPMPGEGSRLSRRFVVQASDGETYEVEYRPNRLGGLPEVLVNDTRQKYGPSLAWMYPLAGLALFPILLGALSFIGWLALVYLGPFTWWFVAASCLAPLLGGLLLLGTPRLLRSLRPTPRSLVAVLIVLADVALAIIALVLLFFGAMYSTM